MEDNFKEVIWDMNERLNALAVSLDKKENDLLSQIQSLQINTLETNYKNIFFLNSFVKIQIYQEKMNINLNQ
jgi:hypothetical protein